MSTVFRLPVHSLAALLAFAVLAACATPGSPPGHQRGHGNPERHGGPHREMQMEGMDMDRLCAMHRAMRDAPEDRRQAIQEEHMKGMSPEMRRQMMDMALRQCH